MNMRNLPLLVPKDRSDLQVDRWGTVTQASPLRVKLDGESLAIPFTPDSLLGPLAVNDRVLVTLLTNQDPISEARRLIVKGKVGGQLLAHNHWSDKVFCKLRRVATQNLADNTNVQISWDTEDQDTHNAHSLVTNPTRFTPPVNGWYGYAGLASWIANATNRRSVEVLKNGAIYPGAQVISPAFAIGATSIFFAGQIYLTTSDYMEVEQWQNSGIALTTSTGNTEANVAIWLELAI